MKNEKTEYLAFRMVCKIDFSLFVLHFSLVLEEAIHIEGEGRHEGEAFCHGTVEVVVFGTVVEDVVDGEGPAEGGAEALGGREFPEGIGGIVCGGKERGARGERNV